MKGNFIYLVANREKKETIPEKHKWEKNFNNQNKYIIINPKRQAQKESNKTKTQLD